MLFAYFNEHEFDQAITDAHSRYMWELSDFVSYNYKCQCCDEITETPRLGQRRFEVIGKEIAVQYLDNYMTEVPGLPETFAKELRRKMLTG